MKIDSIPGPRPDDRIAVHELHYYVTYPEPASGRAGGKKVYHPLFIVKSIDKTSPKLFSLLSQKKVVSKITFFFYRNGDHYFTVHIENVRIVSIKTRAFGTEDSLPSLSGSRSEEHTEEIGFIFEEITWRWRSEQGDIETHDKTYD